MNVGAWRLLRSMAIIATLLTLTACHHKAATSSAAPSAPSAAAASSAAPATGTASGSTSTSGGHTKSGSMANACGASKGS